MESFISPKFYKFIEDTGDMLYFIICSVLPEMPSK